jgi:hypothetical protein
MAEQDAKLVHQLPEFLASQGFQFLQQAAPIEAVAVVIAQGGALLLHPAEKITLVARCRDAAAGWVHGNEKRISAFPLPAGKPPPEGTEPMAWIWIRLPPLPKTR